MKTIDQYSDDEFLALVEGAARLPDAPAHLVQKAIDLWPTAMASTPESLHQKVGRMVQALLSFDSWTQSPLAMGMHGLSGDTRHLLFDAAGRDIDLRISTRSGGFSMNGQILGPDETGTVELALQSTDDTELFLSAELDPFGEFRLDDLRGGTYLLTLRLGDEEIVLPTIEVGARP